MYLKQNTITKEQISEYKTTERQLYENFDTLTEEKLNTKSNETVHVRNDVMATIFKRCRSEKSNRWI